MKNLTSKVFIIISSILLLFCLDSFAQPEPEPRDIIWAHGTSQTSKGWFRFAQLTSQKGYLFNPILTGPSYDDAIGDGVIATAEYLDNRIEFQNGSNVLGIGHGFGGIALRYAQLENDNINAMILSAVPNQGSIAMREATRKTPGDQTQVQHMIDKVSAIKNQYDCNFNCNVIDLFKTWMDAIAAGESFLQDLRPDSDVITDINQTQNLPSVPYIVLYGTVEDFSLTRLLDVRGSVTPDANHLVECIQNAVDDARQNISKDEKIAAINSASGFLASVLKFAGSLLNIDEDSGPGDVLGSISTFINEQSSLVVQEIQAQFEIQSKIAQLLRCQMAGQLLEAEWMLMMLDGAFEEREIFILDDVEPCLLDCIAQFPDDPNSIHHCQNWCYGNLGGHYIVVEYFVAEPTNGLLTESEQKLDGPNLVAEIHLPNSNHLQMSMRGHAILEEEIFDNLFSGSLGLAFKVPKE